MNRKKIIIIAVAFLIGAVLGSPIVNFVYASFTKTIEVATGINIEVNGEKFIPKDANGKEVEVFIYNGTTYLPIRAISGMYGSDIKWDGESQKVILKTSKTNAKTQDKTNAFKLNLDDKIYTFNEVDVYVFGKYGFALLELSENKRQAILENLSKMKRADDNNCLESAFEEGAIKIHLQGESDFTIFLNEDEPYYADNMFWYDVETPNGMFLYKTEQENDVKKEIQKIINNPE